MGRRVGLVGVLQRLHRGIDAARSMRHAGRRQAHLHARERAQQRELVAFAEMADAEHLAGQRAEAAAELQTFWPSIRQPVAVCSARVRTPARSDPAPGSENN